MSDPIARLRRFNRIVTTQIGALDASFLGRGRPLGTARVLNAIGKGMGDIGAIRDYLALDSGLMSRLLRGLEGEGLITTEPDQNDARRRTAHLTAAGRIEFAAYERLANDQAAGILAAHSNPDALLDAMDLVASALGQQTIRIDADDPTCGDARHCLSEYYAELSRRLEQGFDVTLSCDPEADQMRRPVGVFLIARSEGLPVGCVGLKGSGGAIAEIKRLWVAPSARGLGLATRLMQRAETDARDLCITTLRLDTNSTLGEAVGLYRATGWTRIPRFNDDPYPDAFFEKHLH